MKVIFVVFLLMMPHSVFAAKTSVQKSEISAAVERRLNELAEELRREDEEPKGLAFQQALKDASKQASKPLEISNSQIVTPEGRVLFPTDPEYSTTQLQGTSRSSSMDRDYRTGPSNIGPIPRGTW